MMSLVFLTLSLLLNVCARTPSTPGDDTDGPGRGPRTGVVVHEGIEYRGDVAVMESFPVQLAGRVTIKNVGTTTRVVAFPDGCVALLRAYRPGEARPVWDQATEVGCTMAIVAMELAPGQSREVTSPTASGYDILGDGLPDGKYRIAIYLRPNRGELEIDGGVVDLAIPR